MVDSWKSAATKALRALWQAVPLILGILILISLSVAMLPPETYSGLFHFGAFGNSVIGSAVGSISGGSPINSYIIGGELVRSGIGIAPVTAFIFAWVTVGTFQLPIEASFLGLRFAVWRNVLAFLLAILAGWVTGLVL